MNKFSMVLMLPALSGCVTMSQPVASGSAPKNAVGVGVAKGISEGDYFLGLHSGDESVNRAIDDALKNSKADDITNVVIDRCAECFLWIYCHVVTTVRGTLVKYLPDAAAGFGRFGDFDKPDKPAKPDNPGAL